MQKRVNVFLHSLLFFDLDLFPVDSSGGYSAAFCSGSASAAFFFFFFADLASSFGASASSFFSSASGGFSSFTFFFFGFSSFLSSAASVGCYASSSIVDLFLLFFETLAASLGSAFDSSGASPSLAGSFSFDFGRFFGFSSASLPLRYSAAVGFSGSLSTLFFFRYLILPTGLSLLAGLSSSID